MNKYKLILKCLDEAQTNLEYSIVNPPEPAKINALTSIAASLLAIGELLYRMDERAEVENVEPLPGASGRG